MATWKIGFWIIFSCKNYKLNLYVYVFIKYTSGMVINKKPSLDLEPQYGIYGLD